MRCTALNSASVPVKYTRRSPRARPGQYGATWRSAHSSRAAASSWARRVRWLASMTTRSVTVVGARSSSGVELAKAKPAISSVKSMEWLNVQQVRALCKSGTQGATYRSGTLDTSRCPASPRAARGRGRGNEGATGHWAGRRGPCRGEGQARPGPCPGLAPGPGPGVAGLTDLHRLPASLGNRFPSRSDPLPYIYPLSLDKKRYRGMGIGNRIWVLG